MRSTKNIVVLAAVVALLAILGTACYNAAAERPDTEPQRSRLEVPVAPVMPPSYVLYEIKIRHGPLIDWMLTEEMHEELFVSSHELGQCGSDELTSAFEARLLLQSDGDQIPPDAHSSTHVSARLAQ